MSNTKSHAITIELRGQPLRGMYDIDGKLITVHYKQDLKTTQLGNTPADSARGRGLARTRRVKRGGL